MWVKIEAENVHGNTYDWLDNSNIIIEIAAILDEERGKDTVLIALQKFTNGSPLSWIKRRRKKTSHDSTSDNVGYQIQFTESTGTESESDNLPLSSLTRYSTSDNVGYQIQFTESTDTESESDNLTLSSLTR
jgi:hypothetical protein